MACDLITEMALITVVSVADRRWRCYSEREAGETGYKGVASFVTMSHTGVLFVKRIARLMTTSYSAAHITVGATGVGRWDMVQERNRYWDRERRGSYDERSFADLNRERDSRENSTGAIMRLDLYASDSRCFFFFFLYTNVRARRARNDHREK